MPRYKVILQTKNSLNYILL